MHVLVGERGSARAEHRVPVVADGGRALERLRAARLCARGAPHAAPTERGRATAAVSVRAARRRLRARSRGRCHPCRCAPLEINNIIF